MTYPDDRKYSQTHEWHQADGNIVTIGITHFAAEQLSDVTYVDLPAPGSEVVAGQMFGEVESVKATSELYAAISGTVTAVNTALADQPELVNNHPYDRGWMIRVEATDLGGLEKLFSAAEYERRLAD